MQRQPATIGRVSGVWPQRTAVGSCPGSFAQSFERFCSFSYPNGAPQIGTGPGQGKTISAAIMGRRKVGDTNALGLLGGFVFSVGGDALLGVSSGSQRLLAFLALRDRTLTRLHVAGTLWPESTDAHAGASLRSAVSRLDGPARQAVTVTACDLSLAEGTAVDVHHSRLLARRLIDRDAPHSDSDIGAAAVSALSDDLLPGWYDDWAVIAAEDWRQLRMHALEAVAARLTAAGRLAEAAAAALTAVRAEPLRESARGALIRVQMAQGNQSGALEEYERYRVLLLADLGAEPTSLLRDLLGDLEPR